MDQLKDLADARLVQGCVYCGCVAKTRDHVPSKVLLEQPFPENLPVVPACQKCNSGFSQDEEYVACLIECAIAGSANPDNIRKKRVASALRRSPALRSRIESSKKEIDEKIVFIAEGERVASIVCKLAKGHAAFELSRTFAEEPTSLYWWPLSLMTDDQRDSFETPHFAELFGEVGSRGMQRIIVTQVTLVSPESDLVPLSYIVNDWVDVQKGIYRYHAIDDSGGVRIKIVISEFLACEVWWEDQFDQIE